MHRVAVLVHRPGMRNLTEKQLAVMLAESGYSSHYRVRVNAGGTWYDLTSLEGRDFCHGVSWDSTIDSFVASASVELDPLVDGFTVAPLVDSVLNTVPTDARPMLDEGRRFIIEVAVTPLGTRPGDGDWFEVFRGISSRVNMAGRPQLVGRDEGDSLSDLLIREERDYGSQAGVPLLSVLNQILADNGWPYVAVQEADPGFLVGPYRQKKELVREALMQLVDQIGWDLRVKWSDAANTWRLTLWTPDRAQVTPDWSYGPSQCLVVSRCETSVEDVRNQWVGTYLDKGDLDAAGKPKQKQIVVQDSDSISRYSPIPGAGIPRTTLVAEGGTTNIDSAAEMTRMLSAALADFKERMLEVEVEVPFNPFLEVGDMVRLEANPRYFSENQDLGVQSVAHSFSQGRAVTSLTLRGKPSTSLRRWKRYESAGAASPTYSKPNPPSSVSATATINGFAIKVLPAVTGQPVDTWEVHASTTANAPPDNSPNSTTLVKTFKGVGTDVTSLAAGRTYYLKLVGRDTRGNRSVPSAEVALTPRYVTPVDVQPVVVFNSLIPNPSLEAWTGGASSPPDAWEPAPAEFGNPATVWGVDALRTASAYTGGYAVSFPAATSARRLLRSRFVAVGEGIEYAARLFCSGNAILELRWFDSAFTELPDYRLTVVRTDSPPAWATVTANAISPPTSRYLRIQVGRSEGTGDVVIDAVDLDIYVKPQAAWSSSSMNVGPAWTSLSGRPASGYIDSTGRNWVSGRFARSAAGAVGSTIAFVPGAIIDTSLIVTTDAGPGLANWTTGGSIVITFLPPGWTYVDLGGCSARVR